MALTGIGLLGFVVVHMIGNLHIYEGPVQLAEYAEALRDLGGHLIPRTLLLWVMRLGPHRHVRPAHPQRLHAEGDEPALEHPQQRRRRPEALRRRPGLPGRRLRQPHDALDRARSSACTSSSTWPTSPGACCRGPTTSRATRTTTSPRAWATAGGHPLHRRQRRPRHPHLPRHLEPLPEPRHQQPPLQQRRAGGWRRRWPWSCSSATSASRSWCRPGSSTRTAATTDCVELRGRRGTKCTLTDDGEDDR